MFKRRRRDSRDSLRINLTPLIDTVFLLLVFFMMTTTFNRQSELNIDLPQANGEAPKEQNALTRIYITAQGDYAINDTSKTLVNNQLDTLTTALKQVIGDSSNPRMMISADAKTPHEAVMRAMEAARNLNCVHLSFEVEQKSE
ncbi:ExbD/TolR family protein [Beggiatoa leptomitoformis]|uniref:Biopolymer transporter ExbD n=1 Tax=Beggiatoa leptomitoformis TaxID=288004 RepID=A0A2N9YDJ6_9GAMM|nr:biopolymer transporter ExbD [Beggiatoa leptomitoformis]ALG69042.2 biopolymer transporter ExbD [Beggiatoa leptomitoformis]AUI68551.2 biopolymer transporter ExbD [Beggiatoa leptomitoformis]